MEMSRLTRDGTAEPVSRDQILRHARGQGDIIFLVQLTTSRIGNLTRFIHTLLYVMTIHTYIHTWCRLFTTSNTDSDLYVLSALTAHVPFLSVPMAVPSRLWHGLSGWRTDSPSSRRRSSLCCCPSLPVNTRTSFTFLCESSSTQ